jgi:hypothetical protein
MSQPQPACSQCSLVLPEALLKVNGPVSCPSCQAQLEVDLFPSLFRPQLVGTVPERIVVEGEASCYYHPEKRAVVPCDSCGRFLCSLCDVELNKQHVCPSCLQARRATDQAHELISRRILYDGAALMIAAGTSLLFCLWFLWVVTAPVAIFLAVLSWFKPGSLVPRTPLRGVLAILLAVLQLIGFCFIVKNVVFEGRHL